MEQIHVALFLSHPGGAICHFGRREKRANLLSAQVNAVRFVPFSFQTAFTCNLLPWLRLPPSPVGVLFFTG